MQETQEMPVPSLGREDPLEKEMTTHSNILTSDRGAWWATAHGVAKSQTRLKQLSMHAINIINSPSAVIPFINIS